MLTWEETLNQGTERASNSLLHAALEGFHLLEMESSSSEVLTAKLQDEIGKVYVRLGNYKKAIHHFEKACNHELDSSLVVTYRMHLAMTHRRRSEHDKAQRILAGLIEEFGSQLSPQQRGVLFANYAAVLGCNQFYSESLRFTHMSLNVFHDAGISAYDAGLFNNLGVNYLNLGSNDKAEKYLLNALRLQNSSLSVLSLLSELSRLYLSINLVEKSMEYIERAVNEVWASFVNYEKDEVAMLCRLLSQLAWNQGMRANGLRLMEKAQLLFGQLENWSEWAQVQEIVDRWNSQEITRETVHITSKVHEIDMFLVRLDALNAQELLHDRYSALLDTRVLYGQVLARHIGLSDTEREHLIYAARFCDFGLTAMEQEVLLNPTRSQATWAHYRKHPEFSVDMLRLAGLPNEVLDIIIDHHEAYNGDGYPNRKKGDDIHRLARVLSAVDIYSTNLVMDGQTHTEALGKLLSESGERVDPTVAKHFLELFR